MDMQQLSQYLLAKPKTTLSFPFNQDVHVYKVNNKMFALLTWCNDCLMINLKCDPDDSLALQDIFKSITPGYHMDKKHWISICLDGSVPEGEVHRLIDNSFKLVVSKMTKKAQHVILLHL
ncbi:MmcQ/YjbR family DNA-binding protein [Thalassotalea sp. Y01]|uniref:MmcQ/YjbR family DNA-binding protein n=1 Tax=Thalassotalea sp. Y01 TaxID=2729613 RepID=UPI00145F1C2A|nr:MmcQ/YjbR family DNA-binding protein [Thalassotalea sp. Y01]NMP17062.1 MmcQ/YjbR family DNA-binding protein [Thalassotalea sp. Y01]